MIGNKLTPEDAYRFALGETVTTSTGQRARLIRALDFLVVSDHAENLGLAPMIQESNPELLKSEWGREIHDMVKAGNGYEAFIKWGSEAVAVNTDQIDNPKITRTVWDRQVAFAEKFNDPGRFSALIGFEWTSINNMENPSNLHRVVFFKDDGDKAGRVLPFSTFDSEDPEKLWEYMAAYEADTGGTVMAIPHNGNLSNGLMFNIERLNGQPIDKSYAETRMRWEPLVEVTQIKGDGEAHPALSPADEWADYGTWDKGDIAGFKPKEDWMLQYEYARTALQVGLQQEQKLGVNPFKFGMIGASGLMGVWARENTREALFDAMQKKEVYATTGTRMVVRLFGGWDYDEDDVYRPDAVSIGYAKGVPMGGDLTSGSGGKAPVFMVGAMKDPWGANLDRIQVVKGWVDQQGERHEQIYDVAVSDGRAIGADGQCKTAVGNTVDEANASYLNNIGDAQLRAVWTDPDFDPAHAAVYYARVLEIPTPTWQAFDSSFFGITMPDDVPLSHQDRAYTSPIWYTP
jgi:hypothetical protein